MGVKKFLSEDIKSLISSDLKSLELVLMSVPPGADVEVYKNKKFNFLGTGLPYWVKFTLEPISKSEFEMIKIYREYLLSYCSNPYQSFSWDGLQTLSGWDIRLMNLFFARKVKGIRFFELNTAGLSLTSIRLMFNFVINELYQSNYTVKYLIVEPNGSLNLNSPIFLNNTNIEETIKKLYMLEGGL